MMVFLMMVVEMCEEIPSITDSSDVFSMESGDSDARAAIAGTDMVYSAISHIERYECHSIPYSTSFCPRDSGPMVLHYAYR